MAKAPCTLGEETRALLTAAAMAAGIEIVEWVGDQANVNMDGGHYGWNPLARWGTGEALSLAVKLHMRIAVTRSDRVVVSCGEVIWDMKFQPDLLAATQLGIVRVAAGVANLRGNAGVLACDGANCPDTCPGLNKPSGKCPLGRPFGAQEVGRG